MRASDGKAGDSLDELPARVIARELDGDPAAARAARQGEAQGLGAYGRFVERQLHAAQRVENHGQVVVLPEGVE